MTTKSIYAAHNFRTGETDSVTFPIADWRDYIPQSPAAQNLYTLLTEHMDKSPAEAAAHILLKVTGKD